MLYIPLRINYLASSISQLFFLTCGTFIYHFVAVVLPLYINRVIFNTWHTTFVPLLVLVLTSYQLILADYEKKNILKLTW